MLARYYNMYVMFEEILAFRSIRHIVGSKEGNCADKNVITKIQI